MRARKAAGIAFVTPTGGPKAAGRTASLVGLIELQDASDSSSFPLRGDALAAVAALPAPELDVPIIHTNAFPISLLTKQF